MKNEFELNIKAPKRPKTDHENNAVRHIGRNEYALVPVDTFARYLYKYSFDKFCTGYRIKMKYDGKFCDFVFEKETVKSVLILQKDYHSAINQLITALYSIFEDNYEGIEFKGIPIRKGGFICHYAENPADPYHTATIILQWYDEDFKGHKYQGDIVRYVHK